MWLWRVKTDAVLKAMYAVGIDDSRELCRKAPINKNTMTNVNNGMLVKRETLERIAAVLKVSWESLQDGHVYQNAGRRGGGQKVSEDLSSQVMDVLAAFGRLAAYRTGHDAEAIRCLAYLYDEKASYLSWLGASTGQRMFDDRANRIPCSRVESGSAEEAWYIVSRAFR